MSVATEVKIIEVKRGDYILYRNGKFGAGGGWFKASADTKTSAGCPLLAIALEPFEYEDGLGAEAGHDIKNLPVAQYFSRVTRAGEHGLGTPELPKGHRKLMHDAEAKRYIENWVNGNVRRSIEQGKGIKTRMDSDGMITHVFHTSLTNPEW